MLLLGIEQGLEKQLLFHYQLFKDLEQTKYLNNQEDLNS